MIPPSVVHQQDTLRIVTAGNLVIASWFDAPTLEQMRAFRRASQALKQRHPEGTAMVNLIVTGTPRFSAEVREEAALQQKDALHNLGAAHVILVGGLVGTAVRGFLGTMILLGRSKNPTRVFGDVAPASAWLLERLKNGPVEGWTLEDVKAAFELAIEPRLA